MLVRKIENNDLKEIVKIHLNSFDEKHFSKTFSPELLIEYLKLLINYNQFNYVALIENKICGYLIAGSNSAIALNQFKKKFGLKIFLNLLKNPAFIVEKIREIIKSFFPKKEYQKGIRLYLLAIESRKKGMGIGKQLISFLEDKLTEENIPKYGLSVRKENKRAIQFYKSTGYLKVGEDGKSIYFYKKLKTG